MGPYFKSEGYIETAKGTSQVIRYSLRCAGGHEFEAWFANAAAYDNLADAGSVACPDCGPHDVDKAPMAPRLAKGAGARSESGATGATGAAGKTDASDKIGMVAGEGAEAAKFLAKVRAFVESNCEDVGERFPEEARKIHYGETEEHGIYGEATTEEAKELVEEGIPVGQLPWRSRHDA